MRTRSDTQLATFGALSSSQSPSQGTSDVVQMQTATASQRLGLSSTQSHSATRATFTGIQAATPTELPSFPATVTRAASATLTAAFATRTTTQQPSLDETVSSQPSPSVELSEGVGLRGGSGGEDLNATGAGVGAASVRATGSETSLPASTVLIVALTCGIVAFICFVFLFILLLRRRQRRASAVASASTRVRADSSVCFNGGSNLLRDREEGSEHASPRVGPSTSITAMSYGGRNPLRGAVRAGASHFNSSDDRTRSPAAKKAARAEQARQALSSFGSVRRFIGGDRASTTGIRPDGEDGGNAVVTMASNPMHEVHARASNLK
jgi:hypothetical protein